jgi:hypothetical protein
MLPPFPEIPLVKQYSGKMTPEQDVTFKLVQGKQITKQEEQVLEEAIIFYEQAYPYLKSINLADLTDEDAKELIGFMKIVFNMEMKPQNVVRFEETYRISFVLDDFLEKGKVRNLKYLREPPLEVVKKRGVYGRANSPQSTLFYTAINPFVAILETKPNIGDRIILGKWIHDPKEGFITYPIVNEKKIKSEPLEKARKAFMDRMSFNHPLFAKIIDLLMEFISSEFVKDVPIVNRRKYEYLYSGYFADQALSNNFEPLNHDIEPLNHYDALIYPSIATKYQTENLAIVPKSVKKLTPYQFIDCQVESYEITELEEEKIPIKVNHMQSKTI